jgi:putative flavoprotein involved in K+ transport
VTSAPVVVIGGGPAGLASAYSLSRVGLHYRVLEQGAQALSSLRRVDPEMALLSPTRLSRLPGQRPEANDPTYLPFRQVVEHLEQYRQEHGLEVETGCDVTSVRREGQGFVVSARRAQEGIEIEASQVLNASGIIRHPHLPAEFDPRRCTFRYKHSLDVRASDLAGVQQLLVVGAATSAAEVLERWLDQGRPGAPALLSVRHRLLAIRNPLLGVDVHYLAWLPEHLPTAWLPAGVAGLPDPMNGKRVLPAMRAGHIVRKPGVVRYEGSRVVFSDGTEVQPDLVVFATGFRYDVGHLRGVVETDARGRPLVRNCASTITPGLYLLGTRFGRTFASPYLRGIARDARYVAQRIAAGGRG